uniref:Myosin motor domain-containing protein n=1 Tax=Petromyzon marinus TaxID=7757 RepID=S4R5V5_PETMA
SEPTTEIGILNICGFERFQKNSFEQLCVNLASERLQQHTELHLFALEQTQCAQEGVATEIVGLHGNQRLLDFFFQRPQGMLHLLDEESTSAQPSDQALVKRIQGSLERSHTNGVLSMPGRDRNGNAQTHFTIKHFAGEVTYDLTGAAAKNKDQLPQSLLFVMKTSENVVLRQLFQARLSPTGALLPPTGNRFPFRLAKAGRLHPQAAAAAAAATTTCYITLHKLLKKKGEGSSLAESLEHGQELTLTSQLRMSLSDALLRLVGCTQHHLRCVRPNEAGRPDAFEAELVSAQLRHARVLHTVRLRRFGFPARLPFADFLDR